MSQIPVDLFIQELSTKFERRDIARILEMMEILSGRQQPKTEPMQRLDVPLFFPDITNIPWHSDGLPWMKHLEDNYETIRTELQALVDQRYSFENYGPQYDVSSDIPQKTGGSLAGWNAFYFYRAGRRIDKSCAQCPLTAEILQAVPVAQEALFSVLQPDTHIPEHSDDLNFFLTCHMGIKIPEGCALRVGTETRPWREGKTMLFNTSFLHEAWNRSNELRVVLLVDVWHPELTPIEIEAIRFLRPKIEASLGLTAIDPTA